MVFPLELALRIRDHDIKAQKPQDDDLRRTGPAFCHFLALPPELQIRIWRASWTSRRVNLDACTVLQRQADEEPALDFSSRSLRSSRRPSDTASIELQRAARIAGKKARYRRAHKETTVARLITPENWVVPPLPASLYVSGLAHTETVRCYRPLAFERGTVIAGQFWIRSKIRVNFEIDEVKLGGWAMNWALGRFHPPFFQYEATQPSLRPFIHQALVTGPWSHLRHITVDGLFFQGDTYLRYVRFHQRPAAEALENMYLNYSPYFPSREQQGPEKQGTMLGDDILELLENSQALETFTISLGEHDFDRWKHDGVGNSQVDELEEGLRTRETGNSIAHKIRLARCRPAYGEQDLYLLGERTYEHEWAILVVAPFPGLEPARAEFKRLLWGGRAYKWPSVQMGIFSMLPHLLAEPEWTANANNWGSSMAEDWHLLLSCWINGGYRNPCRMYYELEAMQLKHNQLRSSEPMHPAWILPPIHGFCDDCYGF